MNSVEFQKLQDKRLSHEARSLYLFYLRPNAERDLNTIDLPSLCLKMETISDTCPLVPNMDLIEGLLNELSSLGFILKSDLDAPWQGALISLPYFEATNKQIPQVPFVMYEGWRPSVTFKEACLISGLSSMDFSEQDLNSFVSYWSGRHEFRNQYSWERSFALRLLKKQSASIASRKTNSLSPQQSAATAQTPTTTAASASSKAENYN